MYVCGLRESCKAIKCGKALAVLLAPDIQLGTFGKPDRVLDGRMREIILSSQVPQHGRGCVPVVFALSRKKIGQVFGSKKRMSAITLLDVSGVEELYGAVLQLAEEGRQRWEEMQSWH
jgi:ribosomal protein L7Ae-like RNA K-turn-binding protein